jgi:hypothetical protein
MPIALQGRKNRRMGESACIQLPDAYKFHLGPELLNTEHVGESQFTSAQP